MLHVLPQHSDQFTFVTKYIVASSPAAHGVPSTVPDLPASPAAWHRAMLTRELMCAITMRVLQSPAADVDLELDDALVDATTQLLAQVHRTDASASSWFYELKWCVGRFLHSHRPGFSAVEDYLRQHPGATTSELIARAEEWLAEHRRGEAYGMATTAVLQLQFGALIDFMALDPDDTVSHGVSSHLDPMIPELELVNRVLERLAAIARYPDLIDGNMRLLDYARELVPRYRSGMASDPDYATFATDVAYLRRDRVGTLSEDEGEALGAFVRRWAQIIVAAELSAQRASGQVHRSQRARMDVMDLAALVLESPDEIVELFEDEAAVEELLAGNEHVIGAVAEALLREGSLMRYQFEAMFNATGLPDHPTDDAT